MTPRVPGRSKGFISYSHREAATLERLQVHLKPLARDFEIEVWNDTEIKSGARWREEIQQALDKAAFAILLVSADFLASDFIARNELPPLLKAAEEKGTIILPLIIGRCGFIRNQHLSQFQAFNDPEKPLGGLTRAEREAVFERVAERVAELSTAPAVRSKRKDKSGRARRAKRFMRRRQAEPPAEAIRSQDGRNEMNHNHFRQEEAPNEDPFKQAPGSAYLWGVLAASSIVLAIFITVVIHRSSDDGSAATQKTGQAQVAPAWPQLDQVPQGSGVVKITIRNGNTLRAFDRLNIRLDGIRFDEGRKQYLASFTVSSAGVDDLVLEDERARETRTYVYPTDGTFKIKLVWVQASYADFLIEKTMK